MEPNHDRHPGDEPRRGAAAIGADPETEGGPSERSEETVVVPDAVRAGAAHGSSSHPTTLAAARARGVEWVRPTDLLARQAATLSGRGIDFQAELARRARAPITSGLHQKGHRLTDRAHRLPPISAFGRGSPTTSGPARSGVEMS